jgi:hypothetical protein
MTLPGFQEAHSEFIAATMLAVGQFRRLGEAGPAYEVIRIDGDLATVEIVSTDERVTFKIADVIADPIATTFP